ncbi:MAG: cation diffusion facilitator family transporter [Vampirovibrionales bacterium]|nr:cation diffusion facilitator family transporter [Vampirovibrionales bacterium]
MASSFDSWIKQDAPAVSEQSSLSAAAELDSSAGQSFRQALFACLIGMGVNFGIAALKLGVNFLLSPSAALFSEGLHSLGDGLNSVLLLVGVVRANRTADRAHPFGYGLEANFWALFASFILFLSAAWALIEGIHRFEQPTGHTDYFWALVVLALSMAFEVYAIWTASRAVLTEVGVKATLWNTIPLGYRHVREAKAPTTRYVFFEDTLAFLGALTAFIALIGGQAASAAGWLPADRVHVPDAVASIVISVMLFLLAWNLFFHNKGILLGGAAPAKVEADIRRLVLSLHGVSHVHDLKTIDQGHAGLIVNLTVEVEPNTPVKDVDDLTERIKEKLYGRFRAIRQEQVFIEVLADETETEWGAKFEALIDEGRQRGVLRPRDEELIRRATDFSELMVRDVMIPRTDVEHFDIDTPLEEAAARIIETGHTRWPVFNETIDDLLGIVHSRDIFREVLAHRAQTPLANLIREIDIYPETKLVSDLLEEFRRGRLRMAAVADEHGGFAGIVTIEDLMEEIVGDIWDEYEEEEAPFAFLESNRLKISGKANIEDLNDALDLNFPTDEYVTLGGLVFGMLGREPEAGDRVGFEDLALTVDEVEGPRILTIIVESPAPFVKPETAADSDASGESGE